MTTRRLGALFCFAVVTACSSGSSPNAGAKVDAGTGDAIDLDALDAESLPLDAYVQAQMDAAKIPGLSAAIVKGGKVVWTGAYGFADLEKRTKVSVDTIFTLASISKTFTCATAMHLYEQGKLGLDDDVNGALPFSLRNPKFPDVPITYRMLLTHTASINDNYLRIFSLIVAGDSPISMEAFLRAFLLPDGKYWTPDVWDGAKPGTKYLYSQLGATLVAQAVEKLGGAPFDRQARDAILAPLSMTGDASFRLADVDVSRVATPYVYLSTKGQVPQAPWGAPFYPAATMHASAPALGKWLAALTRKGAYDGGRVLLEATVDEMLKVQDASINPDQGFFAQWRTVNGERVVGHGGSAPGVSTTMFFRPSDGVGVITLTNSDVHLRVSDDHDAVNAAYEAIEARLFHESARY